MLHRLFIRDYAIVDRLEMEFPDGFGALTGETGAGKSILVDALSLALGERADNAAIVVRPGRERAEVVAEFGVAADSGLEAWLRENDLDSGDGACLLRRVVDTGGRSRAMINGSPVTLAQMREAAGCLADIHGQNAHHSLLHAEAQRRMFDRHAGLADLAEETAGKYRAWRDLREMRENAERDVAAAAAERDLLEWQVKELHALAFEPGQWQEDNQEQRRLAHAAGLIEGTTEALAALDEGDVAAIAQLDAALSRLHGLLDFDEALRVPADLLDGARIQMNEAAHALARYRERLDPEPGRLAELEARISSVTAAARKHRVPPEELLGVTDRLAARLEELRLSADPAALAEHESAARAAFEAVGKKLSAGRLTAAGELSKAVTDAMQQLAMAGGRFEVALSPVAGGSSAGFENVEFQVAANPGQPLRPLAKVASGGELSRIGLALQVIASSAGQAPTLIFDEVDVGIGGSVAEIVGRMLRQLGRGRQVLCVTHLPQVAAQADWQWSVAKQTKDGATLSQVTPLDETGRIDEVARMLGGVKITETTRTHAREMLGL
ncbi:MAG: DNA repair protein RecN [Candidatus Nitricoxidivorans perseverans]|uniref:DNA repair protein RecN n=1 Tax=Candidatus Nitricoxidivorans perseverans TaxID=2975601 RepID=A0AA49FKE7_9PROT|nr:MAG: DNA repair protein RecN [Candidatus Nitricoxidivorans perseverans]